MEYLKEIEKNKVILLIKRIRKTPLVLSGMLLEMLRLWFKRYSTNYKWDENILKSEIHIDMSDKWIRDITQARPGIYVKRGLYLPRGLGKMGFNELYQENLIDSQKTFAICPIVGYYIFVISKNLGEVEQLSWETAEVLMGLAPVIKQDLDIMDMEIKQISQATKHEEFKEFWVVQLDLQFKFSETWTLEEVAPKFHKVAVESYAKILDQMTNKNANSNGSNKND